MSNCNNTVLDGICTNLVSEFNNQFNLNIALGRNAANYGSPAIKSLDEYFLVEDVVNLAMVAYFDAITNGTFFEDDELVIKYFALTSNVRDLFAKFFESA